MSLKPRAELESLIAHVALGDRASFDQLYHETSARLFAVCLSVLGNRADAEEALQESYLRVWRGAGRYAVNGLSPMTWLIVLARNAAIDRRRHGAARPAEPLAAPDDLPAATPDAETATIRAAEQARLAECLSQLDAARAATLRAVYLEGLSYAEAAARAAVPLNTVRSWLRRGLIALRGCVQT